MNAYDLLVHIFLSDWLRYPYGGFFLAAINAIDIDTVSYLDDFDNLASLVLVV